MIDVERCPAGNKAAPCADVHGGAPGKALYPPFDARLGNVDAAPVLVCNVPGLRTLSRSTLPPGAWMLPPTILTPPEAIVAVSPLETDSVEPETKT